MFEFNIDDHKYSHVHFIGIGGISMSALAEVLIDENYKVSGSDSKSSYLIEDLKKLGAEIYIPQNKDNVDNADLVVYTDAISKDNEELVKALSLNIPVVDRATFLGALMNNYKNSIAVSGTHGKTTTTSILATILNESTLDPTILLGGKSDTIGGNLKIGKKDYILTEACEYKGNILKYFPKIAVVLNIEADHLDYFKNMNHIVDTFVEYGKNIKDDGFLVINSDDRNASKLIENTSANIITFGSNKESDYSAQNISFSEEGYASFILNVKGQATYPINLNLMGLHNIYNTLASIAVAHISGISIEEIINSLSNYKGIHRRLELKGYVNGFKIMDDYAHHPTEIKATLGALKNSKGKDIWCIFQPHTYTRTKLLFDDFLKSFENANKVIITDIYASREKDSGIIHSRELVHSLIENGVDAKYIADFNHIEQFLLENAKEDDIIVTMGAGNIHHISDSLVKKNKQAAI